MWKWVFGGLVGALGGIAVGFALGIFIYPFWFLNDVATEQVENRAGWVARAAGEFTHVNPGDPVHWGRGHATILEAADGRRALSLEPDFAVGPGPRFHVYLVDRPTVASEGDFLASRSTDLGRLRAFRGSQVYAVPAGQDLAAVGSVVVWCKEFGVLISPATLSRPPA